MDEREVLILKPKRFNIGYFYAIGIIVVLIATVLVTLSKQSQKA